MRMPATQSPDAASDSRRSGSFDLKCDWYSGVTTTAWTWRLVRKRAYSSSVWKPLRRRLSGKNSLSSTAPWRTTWYSPYFWSAPGSTR